MPLRENILEIKKALIRISFDISLANKFVTKNLPNSRCIKSGEKIDSITKQLDALVNKTQNFLLRNICSGNDINSSPEKPDFFL